MFDTKPEARKEKEGKTQRGIGGFKHNLYQHLLSAPAHTALERTLAFYYQE